MNKKKRERNKSECGEGKNTSIVAAVISSNIFDIMLRNIFCSAMCIW